MDAISAAIAAISFWFAVVIGLVGAFNEPAPSFREGIMTGNYFTGNRVFLFALAAAVLTAVTWAVALSIAEQ